MACSMSLKMARPWLMVLSNLSSSSLRTFKIMAFFSSSSGYPSLDKAMTVSLNPAMNFPSMPRILPWRAARRSTYPLPSLEGMIPSEIIKVQDFMWSAMIRRETSFFSSDWYWVFARAQTLSKRALLVSTVNRESTS